VFGKDSVTIDNLAEAIATHERTRVSGNSRFDNVRFVDKGADPGRIRRLPGRVIQRMATIGAGDGGSWRVPFGLLRHVLDI
jgi:hypothetical protein